MKGQWHGVKHNKQQGRHSYLCCWDLVQKLNFDHQTGILRQIFRNVYCCKTKISLPKCLLFFILFFQECRQILWRSSLLFWEPLPRRVCSTSKRLTGHFAILLYVSLLSSHFSFFRRGSTIIVLFQEEGSLTGRVCHRIWQAGRNQSSFCGGELAVLISCQGLCNAKFSSFNRRNTSSKFRDGKNRASEIS